MSRVRLAEVAAAAGVSSATVSRALSQPQTVAPATRAAVAAAVAATGYRPNVAARNLRRQRTGAVVAMVPNLGNPFFARILSGMGQALAEAGFDLLVGDTVTGAGRHVVLERFLDRARADGVILLDGAVTAADLPSGPGVPPIITACEWIPGTDLPRVRLDNEAGTSLGTRHLLDLGHRHIAALGGPPGNVLHRARLDGMAEVLGAPPPVLAGDFSLEAGRRAADLWLAMEPRPTAVLAFSDAMAAGFVSALAARGLRVPDAVSVVGFDDIEVAAHLTPPLTSVRQPKRALGKAAAEAILALIEGRETAPDMALAPDLIIRASTAPV